MASFDKSYRAGVKGFHLVFDFAFSLVFLIVTLSVLTSIYTCDGNYVNLFLNVRKKVQIAILRRVNLNFQFQFLELKINEYELRSNVFLHILLIIANSQKSAIPRENID